MLFSKQFYRLYRLKDKVDFVITDSPLLLSLIYASDADIYPEFSALAFKIFKKLKSVNYILGRTYAFKKEGRIYTEEQSAIIDGQIHKLLDDNSIYYTDTPSMADNDVVADWVDSILNIAEVLNART